MVTNVKGGQQQLAAFSFLQRIFLHPLGGKT